MAKALEDTAQRIAEQGREALRERLRAAFEEAAAAHAEVLTLDSEGLERMIQDATDRADGLQWRRALAGAATAELGIGLGEALAHPAVARAQEIVGAPSYEEGLEAIAGGKPPEPGRPPPGKAAGPEPSPDEEPAGDAQGDEGGGWPVSVAVVHLNGLSELEGESELELQFSEAGLEIVRASGGAALASFSWGELNGIGVHPGRARRWRRRDATRVIISAKGRHGRFDAPGVGSEELTRSLAPAVDRLGSSG